MGYQKNISYKNPRHGAPGPIGTSKSNIARDLKFRIQIEDGSHYPYIAKTKALISGYREADLRLCFRIFK